MLSLPTFHISIRVFVPWRSLKETEFKNLPNFPARDSVPLVQRAKNQKPTPVVLRGGVGAVNDHTWDLPEPESQVPGVSRCGQIQNFTQCVESSL